MYIIMYPYLFISSEYCGLGLFSDKYLHFLYHNLGNHLAFFFLSQFVPLCVFEMIIQILV